MIPISDDNSDRRTIPIVNYIFIAVNILVFVYYQRLGSNVNFTYSYSAVPAEILSGHDIVTAPVWVRDPVSGQPVLIPGLGVTDIPVWLTLITSMFMHGGFAHLGGNMLYLWIFGDNLEDRLGHINYFFFYLLCGIIASLTHVFSDYLFGENHLIPSLGASGAISAVIYYYFLPGVSPFLSFFSSSPCLHSLCWVPGFCYSLPMAQDILEAAKPVALLMQPISAVLSLACGW